MSSEAFLLSRIYAAGWNAAQKLSDENLAALDGAEIARMTPYDAAVERARWNDGFAAALAKRGFVLPAA